MGGLVVLQAAARAHPQSLILLEPSPPGEIQGLNAEVAIAPGTFDPEAVYGRFPAGLEARPESSLARAERKRGISVRSVPCPSLVIYGDAFRDERGRPIASLYGSEERDFPGLDHWDLVRDRRVREAIADSLGVFRPLAPRSSASPPRTSRRVSGGDPVPAGRFSPWRGRRSRRPRQRR
jgi:hypothetical protein